MLRRNQERRPVYVLEIRCRTWELTKQSFAVIAADKRLLIFPVLSGIAVLIVSVSFAIPVFMSGALAREQRTPADYVVLFLFYFANYFVVLFFNCALVACANICLSGGHATVKDGLSAAWSRLPRIFMWAVVAATVGFCIRLIEERVEKLGKIIAWLLGTAWTLMTYFIVPVLMFENEGVVDSVKRSTSVLKKFKDCHAERGRQSESRHLLFLRLGKNKAVSDLPEAALPET